MRPVVFGMVLALLAVIWSCGPPAHAGSQRHLLPETPTPTPAGPQDERVLWGMPMLDYLPLTLCPKEGVRRSWAIWGRDGELIHAMAAFTHQLDGCVQVYMHNDPLDNLTNGKFHVYGHAMYWSPHMMGRVQYLYPHAQDPICLVMRRAGFEKQEIFSAFATEVYFVIALYLLIFVLILRFGFKVDAIQAVTEVTETFVTGGFADNRRPLMIWGSIFSLIVLNSFSGVFTSFLTVPKRGYEIDTLEEVVQNFDHITTLYQLRQTFLSQVDRSDDPELFALFDTKKDFAELRGFRYPKMDTDSHFRIMQLETLNSVEIRQVKECVWTSTFVSFAAAKNWPLADRYNSLLMRLVQAGVVQKATDDGWRIYSQHYFGNRAVGPPPEPPKLSLDHFVESFVILGMGTGAGLVCLLAELAPLLWTKINASSMLQTTK